MILQFFLQDFMLNAIEQKRRQRLAEGKEILSLVSGNPCEQGIYFPMERLQRIYGEYFKKPDYQPHPKGLFIAREALAEFYSKLGFNLSPENFILTSGTSESFFHLFRLLGKAGANFLAPRPAYPLFEHLADLARVHLKFYDLQEARAWAIDFESLEKAADQNTAGLLLISPHNPTGVVASREEIKTLSEFCRQKNLPLICDEVFSDFYFQEGLCPRPGALEDFPLVFTLNGISKRFALPMMKLGWMAVGGDAACVDFVLDQLETYADTFLSVHMPIQRALPDLLKYSEDFVENYVEEVKRRKNLAVKFLKTIPKLQFKEPEGGFYLTFKVLDKVGLEEETWVLKLLEQTGVLVHPGYFFDYEKGVHGVMSFLTDPVILEQAFERIKNFFKI
ncbi:MAG: pyridoxal phosphate-dependent aminotransferase [Deltaproteobacteria bacterium]|nr:pyridoxal phosphate-dependent aminotransferase [Deltaproteobacteria bacterium]